MNLEIPAVAFIVIEKLLAIFTFDFPGVTLENVSEKFKAPKDDKIFTDVD